MESVERKKGTLARIWPFGLLVAAVLAVLGAWAMQGDWAPGSLDRGPQNSGALPLSSSPTPDARGTPGVLQSTNPHADEAMEAISSEGVMSATEMEGGKPLDFRIDGDVKVFELTTKPVK